MCKRKRQKGAILSSELAVTKLLSVVIRGKLVAPAFHILGIVIVFRRYPVIDEAY